MHQDDLKEKDELILNSSPKLKRRPLPFLLSLSFFYGWRVRGNESRAMGEGWGIRMRVRDKERRVEGWGMQYERWGILGEGWGMNDEVWRMKDPDEGLEVRNEELR